MASSARSVSRQSLDKVVIRFCGDSGDGMQLTGMEFTKASAIAGNDLSTLPDYPAEIRAPAGTLAGVSGYQLNFSSEEVYTPGDRPDVLVAMNPAALKTNLGDLMPGGILIVNEGAFNKQNLEKAGYAQNPLDDAALGAKYTLFRVDITKLTHAALLESGLSNKEVERCKNFFALGLMFWMYDRPFEQEVKQIEEKFGKNPAFAQANIAVFRAGYAYGETVEMFQKTIYRVAPARIESGTYRNITGNESMALGLVAAAYKSGLRLFLGSYPITPASDILHTLSSFRHFGVTTLQAEDEIAGIGAAIGASFAGAIGLTTTSGPGLALKSEAANLAVMLELPLVIVNVQRGGPSTGLPTKTEQSDLLQALWGRNGDSPIPVLAASTPADCFETAMLSVKTALKYMTPVIVLSDGYIANGAEPWKVPAAASLPDIEVHFRTDPIGFKPYARDAATLARPWAIPGTPGLEHRIGGIEKEDGSGNVSYDPINHEKMTWLRARKVAGIARDIPATEVHGSRRAKVGVVGWGSTYGAITQAINTLRARGESVSSVHLRWINPLPSDLGDVLRGFDKVLVPEMNTGQLSLLLRARYLIDAIGLNKIQGQPFKIAEIIAKVEELLGPKRVASAHAAE